MKFATTLTQQHLFVVGFVILKHVEAQQLLTRVLVLFERRPAVRLRRCLLVPRQLLRDSANKRTRDWLSRAPNTT